MLFNDRQGFTVRMNDLVAVVKIENAQEDICEIRYVTQQGINMQVLYRSHEARDQVYDRCIQEWSGYHREGDAFDSFMRSHAIKGAKLAEERAEDGKKGWE